MRKPSPIVKPLTDGSEVQGSLAVESFERLNLRNQTQFYEDELKQIECPSHSEEGSGSKERTSEIGVEANLL